MRFQTLRSKFVTSLEPANDPKTPLFAARTISWSLRSLINITCHLFPTRSSFVSAFRGYIFGYLQTCTATTKSRKWTSCYRQKIQRPSIKHITKDRTYERFTQNSHIMPLLTIIDVEVVDVNQQSVDFRNYSPGILFLLDS